MEERRRKGLITSTSVHTGKFGSALTFLNTYPPPAKGSSAGFPGPGAELEKKRSGWELETYLEGGDVTGGGEQLSFEEQHKRLQKELEESGLPEQEFYRRHMLRPLTSTPPGGERAAGAR
eukprot:1084684-Prorocentrum_minimum.AAC.1